MRQICRWKTLHFANRKQGWLNGRMKKEKRICGMWIFWTYRHKYLKNIYYELENIWQDKNKILF